MVTQPEDYKPAKSKQFTFADKAGKKHSLPHVSAGRSKLSGRDLRDAALGGDVGQLGYMLKILENADPDAKALDALYDMPESEMLEILSKWGDHGDGDGASLGESVSSST